MSAFFPFMLLLSAPTYKDSALSTSLFPKLHYMTYNNNSHILFNSVPTVDQANTTVNT